MIPVNSNMQSRLQRMPAPMGLPAVRDGQTGPAGDQAPPSLSGNLGGGDQALAPDDQGPTSSLPPGQPMDGGAPPISTGGPRPTAPATPPAAMPAPGSRVPPSASAPPQTPPQPAAPQYQGNSRGQGGAVGMQDQQQDDQFGGAISKQPMGGGNTNAGANWQQMRPSRMPAPMGSNPRPQWQSRRSTPMGS